jgi:general secretion pathway protein C
VSSRFRRQQLSAALILVTLAGTGHLLARGANAVFAERVLQPGANALHGAVAAASAPAPARAPGSEPPDIRAILARNIFDPATGPLPKPPPPPPPVTARSTRGGATPAVCEGSLRLVASVFSQRTRDRSLASIAIGGNAPQLYRKGSRVQDMKVVAVLPSSVHLRSADGRLCALHLFGSEADTPPGAFEAEATAITEPAAISERELDDGIAAAGARKFAIERSLVERVLDQRPEVTRPARAVLHQENGQVLGVKLYGIRRNGLLGKLGLQNGDMLRSINGYDLTSPDSALDAYAKLRNASHLSLALVRRGQPLTVDYVIR